MTVLFYEAGTEQAISDLINKEAEYLFFVCLR